MNRKQRRLNTKHAKLKDVTSSVPVIDVAFVVPEFPIVTEIEEAWPVYTTNRPAVEEDYMNPLAFKPTGN